MYGKDADGIGRPVLVDETGKLITVNDLADAAINGRLFSVLIRPRLQSRQPWQRPGLVLG